MYRGKLVEAEDNMNCQFATVNVTYRDGRTAELENVYIRGSKIRFPHPAGHAQERPDVQEGRGARWGRREGQVSDPPSARLETYNVHFCIALLLSKVQLQAQIWLPL